MNEKFPFAPHFNRAVFQDDVSRALARPASEDPEERFLRERGLRYVIEAPPDMPLEHVAGIVRDVLHRDFNVEPLFVGFENNPVPQRLRGFVLVSLPGVVADDLSQNPYELAYALLAQSPFLSVEPDLPYMRFLGVRGGVLTPPKATTNDDKAWSLRNIGADKAWALTSINGQQNGKGVSVAHLDTGWTTHVDLDQKNFDHSRAKDFISPKGNAEDPVDYSGNPGHGTRTGSVIMSRGDVTNTTPPGTLGLGQVTGVAREITYVPIRCIKRVIIFSSDISSAVGYATACSCDVISMSLGGRPMKALRLAVQDAVSNDLLVVCAAGNWSWKVVWPARYSESLAVAANDWSSDPWIGSARERRIDITAPGKDVWKAEPDPAGIAVSRGDGTSYATANLAGVAALWLAFHGKRHLQAIARAANTTLQEIFRNSAKSTARVPSGWDTTNFGAGIVDAERLLSAAPTTTFIARGPVAVGYARELGSLVNEDDPEAGVVFLAKLFKVPKIELEKYMEAFGHELAILLLENGEGLNWNDVSSVRQSISEHGSETLRKALGS